MGRFSSFPGLRPQVPSANTVSSLHGSRRFPAPEPGMQMLLEWESKSRSQPWEASPHTRSQRSRYMPRNLPERLPRPSPCQRSTSDLTLFPQAEAMEHTCLTAHLQIYKHQRLCTLPPHLLLSAEASLARRFWTLNCPPPHAQERHPAVILPSSCRCPLFRIVNQPLLPMGSPPTAHRHSV